MQPTLGRDRRQITDWLAQGKFAALRRLPRYDRAKNQGLPVDELDNVDWKEGLQLTSGGGSMSLIKGGPNPNAARFLSIGFFRAGDRSRCKNITICTAKTRRIRGAWISPKICSFRHNRMIAGKKYFDVSDPKYADMTPMFNVVKEIMKGREAK